MKHSRTGLLALIGLSLLWALYVCFWRKPASSVRLEISGRTVEQGKSVAFFRIKGAEKGLLQVEGIYLLDGSNEPIRLVRGSNGLYGCWADIGPEIIDPIDDRNRQKPEFAMIEPTNKVWSLKTELIMEDRSLFKRLAIMLDAWKATGKGHALSALRNQKNIHALKIQSVVSDPVTNTLQREVSSNM